MATCFCARPNRDCAKCHEGTWKPTLKVSGYVWERLVLDYNEWETVGLYTTLEAAMGEYPCGWEKDGDDRYRLKNQDNEWQGEYIVRKPVYK